jgi:ankyrin repeat protein
MLSHRISYLQAIMLVLLLSFPVSLYSQEEEFDTTEYEVDTLDLYFHEEINNFLMIASSRGSVPAIHWLIKHGAEINAKTYENVSPLMFAVANNHTDAVKALLTYNPDVNLMTLYSETPLLAAVKNGNLEIAEALIRDSAYIDVNDKHGATPLHYASIYGYFYLVDMLLYYDADNDEKSDDGTTPLMASLWAGFADIADLLIQNGADVEAKDNNGFTPFLIAAQNGDTLAMEMLLKYRVNIYEINNFNYDALDLCIKSNHKEATEYLLRKGDKWTSTGNNSMSPHSIAAKYNRKEITNLLKRKNIPVTYRFGFDQVSVFPSLNMCFHDYFTGIIISFKEPSLNTGIIAGFDFKPGYTRVLIKETEELIYQYFDKRSIAYAGLFKDFPVTDNPFKGNWSFSGSLLAGYTFGNKLKGTNIAPEKKLKIIPYISMKWIKSNLTIFGGFDYNRTEFYKVGPIWFRTGLSYTFFFDNVRAPGKIIKWY